MTGRKLKDLGALVETVPGYYSVKEAVFPFNKFPEADPILGPEMKSTGEVMGLDVDFPHAFAKAQLASSIILPMKGTCFISVKDRDKENVVKIGRDLIKLGTMQRPSPDAADVRLVDGTALRRQRVHAALVP